MHVPPKSIIMRKFYVTRNETVFFQGKKELAFSKVTRWPLLLLLLLILIAGSAYTTARGRAGGHPAGQAKVKPVTRKLGGNNLPPGAPTISYPGPKTYGEGQTISLAPSSSGVAAFGYSNIVTPYGSGFKIPYGLATDAAGNLYVADNYYGVIKIPAGNGIPVNLAATNAVSVATDAAGNVYYAVEIYTQLNPDEQGVYDGYIYKLPAGSSTPVQLDSEGDEWFTITADPKGDVYIVGFDDGGDFELEEIPAGTKLLLIS